MAASAVLFALSADGEIVIGMFFMSDGRLGVYYSPTPTVLGRGSGFARAPNDSSPATSPWKSGESPETSRATGVGRRLY